MIGSDCTQGYNVWVVYGVRCIFYNCIYYIHIVLSTWVHSRNLTKLQLGLFKLYFSPSTVELRDHYSTNIAPPLSTSPTPMISRHISANMYGKIDDNNHESLNMFNTKKTLALQPFPSYSPHSSCLTGLRGGLLGLAAVLDYRPMRKVVLQLAASPKKTRFPPFKG